VDLCIQGFLPCVIFIIRDFKQVAMAAFNAAAVDAESWGESVTVTRQISILNKPYPNSDYGVSPSFAFAVSKTQGRRNYWKTRSVKCFFDKLKTIYDRV